MSACTTSTEPAHCMRDVGCKNMKEGQRKRCIGMRLQGILSQAAPSLDMKQGLMCRPVCTDCLLYHMQHRLILPARILMFYLWKLVCSAQDPVHSPVLDAFTEHNILIAGNMHQALPCHLYGRGRLQRPGICSKTYLEQTHCICK